MAKGSYEGQGRTFNRAVHDVEVPRLPVTEKGETVRVHTPNGYVEFPVEVYEAMKNTPDERVHGDYR